MTKPTRVRRALALLRRAFHWQKSHGHDAQAARIKKAQDDLTPPAVITFPGVAAARKQSEVGGFPGSSDRSNPGADWCLKMVRLCYAIAAVALDAIGAWNASLHKHHETDPQKIPRGYPVFWSGGSHGHGHIAISAGDGMCWSTDIRRVGFFDKVPISEIHAKWGLTLLGWTEDLNGEHVPAEKRS